MNNEEIERKIHSINEAQHYITQLKTCINQGDYILLFPKQNKEYGRLLFYAIFKKQIKHTVWIICDHEPDIYYEINYRIITIDSSLMQGLIDNWKINPLNYKCICAEFKDRTINLTNLFTLSSVESVIDDVLLAGVEQ